MAREHAEAKPEGKKKTGWDTIKERLSMHKRLSKKELRKREMLKKRKELEKKRILRRSLLKAGIEIEPEKFSKWVFKASVLLNIIVAIVLVKIYSGYFEFVGIFYAPIFLIAGWLATFLLVFFLLWLSLYLTFDFLSYRRRVGIEEVLPDFLLMASANIRSGMPVDRALWYAVRPRFGVLAKEIELAAKETMSGEDLEVALKKFADKYDSPLLKNTINLLIEGINAGGEIGNLLNNISLGIQENKTLKKEMIASISAYAIFIAVAAIIMAPLMFALSSQLLAVISDITGGIDMPDVSMPTFAFAPGSVGVSQGDFMTFAFTNLFFTACISAMIFSIIKKGEIRAGLKYIPIFIVVSLLVFFMAFRMFSGVFADLI